MDEKSGEVEVPAAVEGADVGAAVLGLHESVGEVERRGDDAD